MADDEKVAQIERGKEAVRALTADHNRTEQVLQRIRALESALRGAALALDRAKGLVGPSVTIEVSGDYQRPTINRPASEWFDKQIDAVQAQIRVFPAAPL